MEITLLKSKIHTVIVTEANVKYNWSITIDEDLLDAANIKKYEQVYINNDVSGSRSMTYVLLGKRGSRVMFMNGVATKQTKIGDTVHILSFIIMSQEEAENYKSTLVFTEINNQNKSVEKYT